jgi:hypothetical protein
MTREYLLLFTIVTISRREYDNSIVLLDSSKTGVEWCPLIFLSYPTGFDFKKNEVLSFSILLSYTYPQLYTVDSIYFNSNNF